MEVGHVENVPHEIQQAGMVVGGSDDVAFGLPLNEARVVSIASFTD